MKAIVLHETGGVEKLICEEVPIPKITNKEVLVQLKAAALNHRDVWIRIGRYAGIKLPVILGSDGAGVVVETGSDVDPSLLGKEVVINPSLDWGDDERIPGPNYRILGLPDDGTYAEYIKVPAENVFPKPKHLTFEEAAALPLAALTAYRAVVTRGKIQAGQNVVVIGIGGGVACFALQILHAIGANAYVTSSSDEKIKKAISLGAKDGVNYKNDDWVKELKGKLNNQGPDVVIDSVGGDTFDKILDLVQPGGTIVTYGATLGPANQIQVRRIYWKQLDVIGSTMGSPREFKNVLKLYEEKKIKPVVDSVFPLEETAKAHQRMEEGDQFGKIVLRIEG